MILRVYITVWILGWVACLIAFMSVHFSSRKTIFKSLLNSFSTAPWHLAICRASKLFLIVISTPGGSIEKVPIPLIASRHLVDRLSLITCVWCFCTSTLARHLYLSMAISSILGSTPCSTPSSVELYWGSIYTSSCNLNLISLILSLDTSIFSPPKPFSLTPNLFPKGFSSFFKSFFTW